MFIRLKFNFENFENLQETFWFMIDENRINNYLQNIFTFKCFFYFNGLSKVL